MLHDGINYVILPTYRHGQHDKEVQEHEKEKGWLGIIANEVFHRV